MSDSPSRCETAQIVKGAIAVVWLKNSSAWVLFRNFVEVKLRLQSEFAESSGDKLAYFDDEEV